MVGHETLLAPPSLYLRARPVLSRAPGDRDPPMQLKVVFRNDGRTEVTMTPVEREKSDRKMLLAVAGLVVAGATAIALIAGLTAQDDSRRVAQDKPVFDSGSARAVPRPVPTARESAVTFASLPVVEPESATETEPVAETFAIDPDEDFVARGLELYGKREFDHAAAYFGAESEARPDRAWTYYMLGLSLWKSGSPDEAEVAMEQAATLDTDSVPTFVNLSRIRNDLGEFERALEASQLALAIDTQDPSALFLEGRSFYNLGRIDEALASLTASLSADPSNGYAQNLLGLALVDEGRVDEAVTVLQQAIALEPQVAYMHNNLGMAFELGGRPTEAVAAYRESVAVDPTHAKAVVNLSRVEPLASGVEATQVAETVEAPEAPEPVVELAEVETVVEPTEPNGETDEITVVADGDGTP
jgi:tetratricopeptide (TPR) repeat protein